MRALRLGFLVVALGALAQLFTSLAAADVPRAWSMQPLTDPSREGGAGVARIDSSGRLLVASTAYQTQTPGIGSPLQVATRSDRDPFAPAQVLGGQTFEPALSTGSNGEATVAWTYESRVGAREIRYSDRGAGGDFGPAQTLSTGGGVPRIATNARGDTAILFVRQTIRTRKAQYWAAVRPAGGVFGAPHPVSGEMALPRAWLSNAAMLPDGTAIYAYGEPESSEISDTRAILKTVREPLGGLVGAPQAMSESGHFVGSIRLVADGEGDAMLAWVEASEEDTAGAIRATFLNADGFAPPVDLGGKANIYDLSISDPSGSGQVLVSWTGSQRNAWGGSVSNGEEARFANLGDSTFGPSTVVSGDTPLGSAPVVALNDAGAGLVAYNVAGNGYAVRYDPASGFGRPMITSCLGQSFEYRDGFAAALMDDRGRASLLEWRNNRRLSTSGLYLLDDSVASKASPGACPGGTPISLIETRPKAVVAGQPVQMDASVVTDWDATYHRFRWDLDGDGNFETDTGNHPRVTTTYALPGTYHVAVEVAQGYHPGGGQAIPFTITVGAASGSRAARSAHAVSAPPCGWPGAAPSGRCTRGLAVVHSSRAICSRRRSPAASPSSETIRNVWSGYGLHWSNKTYTLDPLIPPALGGARAKLGNLWPLKTSELPRKARLAHRLNLLVCTRRLHLKTAQRAMAGNWHAAYRRYLRRH